MRLSIVFNLTLFLSGFSTLAAVAPSPVIVDAAKAGQFSYNQRPRLSQVLNDLDGADIQLYWPAARLYQDDALHYYGFERKRQRLIEKLTLLAQEHDGAKVVTPLLQLVKTAKLATPVKVILDPDAVSSRPALNPLLDNGQYLLRVTKRPSELTVLGFAGSHQVIHRHQSSVRDYSADLNFDALADQTLVYVLGVDLSVIVLNRSLWAESKQEIRPGSVLYIPLDESALPNTFQGFNQLMVEFLQHRVVNE